MRFTLHSLVSADIESGARASSPATAFGSQEFAFVQQASNRASGSQHAAQHAGGDARAPDSISTAVPRPTERTRLPTIHYSLFTIHYSRSSAFTVLELIMVISVLSVLLAIILPTIKTVREAALRKHAKAGATAMTQAAIRYKNEYGFWPGQVTRKDDLSVQLNPMISRPGEWLSLIVCGPKSFTDGLKVNMTAPNLLKLNENEVFQAFCIVGPVSGSHYSLNPLNPKGIEFLQLDSESDFNKVDFPDPWGQAYVLFMGLNPRTLFTYEIKDADDRVIATHSVSNQIAFAFSRGFSGPHQTRCIYSEGVSP